MASSKPVLVACTEPVSASDGRPDSLIASNQLSLLATRPVVR